MTPKTPKKHKQRFEHYFFSTKLESEEQVNSVLSSIQSNGWELVSSNEATYQNTIFINLFFKRPV